MSACRYFAREQVTCYISGITAKKNKSDVATNGTFTLEEFYDVSTSFGFNQKYQFTLALDAVQRDI